MKKKQSEMIDMKKKRKISKKTVTYYYRTAQKQVLSHFINLDATIITEEQIQEYFDIFEKDIVYINNAYKDNEIYDDNMQKIDHERGEGDLKTPESYRDIEMHSRLKRLLLMIKSVEMEKYQRQGKKWNETDSFS